MIMMLNIDEDDDDDVGGSDGKRDNDKSGNIGSAAIGWGPCRVIVDNIPTSLLSLLAPTGALVLMMVYYISTHFFRF